MSGIEVDVIRSCPGWIWGPRTSHFKFGGDVLAGLPKVADRLLDIHKGFPNDCTSLHICHELMSELHPECNSPNAVKFEVLCGGIEKGVYPQVAALTAPAFALDGVEGGAILSEDLKIRERTWYLHREAMRWANELQSQDQGLGFVICWPAFDSERLYHGPKRQQPLSRQQAWDMLRDFWVKCISESRDCGENVLVLLEWKPAVPGDQDYINSIGRAIRFCQEVNAELGFVGMMINNESAHLLIGGTTVAEGTRQTIEAGLFPGFVHVNSAELAIIEINDDTGDVLRGAPGDDKDWYVGAGGDERWDDQVAAVKLMLDWAKETGQPIIAEHDIDPSGDDPRDYYARSRANFDQMLAQVLS